MAKKFLDKVKKLDTKIYFQKIDRFVFDKKKGMWGDRFKPYSLEDATETIYEVTCGNCGKPLLFACIDEDASLKIISFVYSKDLMAYRARPDYLIGLECTCGYDTRLSEHKEDKKASIKYQEVLEKRLGNKYLAKQIVETLVKQPKEVAHWNADESKFKLKEVK